MTDTTTYPTSVHCSFQTKHGSISIAPWIGPEGGYALWHRGEVAWPQRWNFDMAAAPRDGRSVLLWMVHPNAKFSADPIAEGWAAPVVASWIDHNGGGWTWHGLCGVAVAWHPLPAPPTTEPQG